MKARIGVLAVLLSLAVVACGGGDEVTDLEGTDVTLQMFDNRFEYTEIRIPVGGSVDYVNGGRNPHNAVAADGSWSTEEEFGSLDMLEGDSAVLEYDQPGTYIFFCTFHGNAEGAGMAATLIVGDGA
ncbi:MAG TPA: plastocyanin/azurin family copper-binding protein [Acidimicrobiia bacterium]